MKPLLTYAICVLFPPAAVCAGLALDQPFNDVSTLPGAGWVQINNSAPAGTSGWFQGNTGVFPSQQGPPDAYIAANFVNANPGGTVSNWLITPVLSLNNDYVFSFFTRTEFNPAIEFDQLQVRLSVNGGSTNVGSSATSVGDFTTLLLTVNPTPNATGYPASWTRFSSTLSGFAAPATGRIAFRYFVADTNVNGDYIGIDTVQFEVPEPATWLILAGGLAFICRRRRVSSSRNS